MNMIFQEFQKFPDEKKQYSGSFLFREQVDFWQQNIWP